MLCDNCGANLAESDVFCTRCGAKVDAGAKTSTADSPSPADSPGSSPTPKEPAPPPLSASSVARASAGAPSPSEYLVVPFNASLMRGEGPGKAANQLSELINGHARAGWQYVRMETIRTTVTTPGSAGCFGIGATPTLVEPIEVYVVVFSR